MMPSRWLNFFLISFLLTAIGSCSYFEEETQSTRTNAGRAGESLGEKPQYEDLLEFPNDNAAVKSLIEKGVASKYGIIAVEDVPTPAVSQDYSSMTHKLQIESPQLSTPSRSSFNGGRDIRKVR